MTKHILIIQGHPDPDRTRFGYQLSQAYRESALQAGFAVKEIFVADIDFPLLRSYHDFYGKAEAPVVMREYQQLVDWADHLVIFYPLWLGTMPALFKGFLEQLLHPGFAFSKTGKQKKLLQGKTAHTVITMGMPAFAYRWFFRAHSLKNLQHNILGFCGIRPTRSTLIGVVESKQPGKHRRWLAKMTKMGKKAQ